MNDVTINIDDSKDEALQAFRPVISTWLSALEEN